MEARIILSNADFSANNIGKYVELSDFTKKVLSKQTQYSEDSDEANALNIFLNHLTEDGFIGGSSPLLDMLIIPGLARDHSELMYDIAQLDENGYPSNIMPAAEQSAEASKRCYRPITSNGKVVALQRYSDSTMQTSDANAQTRFSNVTWLNAGNVANQPLKSFSVVLCPNQANNGVFLKNPEASLNIFDYKATLGAYVTTGELSKASFALYCYNQTQNRFEGFVDNTAFTGEQGTSTVNWKSGDNFNQLEIGRFNYSEKVEIALLAMGSFIPDTKRASLKQYIDALLSAIHVI